MDTPILQKLQERLKTLSESEQVQVLKFIDSIETDPNADNPSAGLAGLWNEIDEIIASVPEDAWDEVPTDGAANHDHYLYGAQKRY